SSRVPEMVTRVPTRDIGDAELSINRDGLVKVGDGVRELAESDANHPSVVIDRGGGLVRQERQYVSIIVDGPSVIAACMARGASAKTSVGIVGGDGERAIKVQDCSVEVFDGVPGRPSVAQSFGIAGADLDRSVEVGQRSGVITRRLAHKTAIVIGL